jgi:hypothetical protein
MCASYNQVAISHHEKASFTRITAGCFGFFNLT